MSNEQQKAREVPCPYCGLPAELVDSTRVYRKSYGMLWLCQTCQAWVGVHKDSKTHKPKGTLAKAELRSLRQAAHRAFDPIWIDRHEQGMSKSKARQSAYRDLAIKLQISDDECHIGHFDEDRCKEVIEICRTWKEVATEAATSEGM